MWFSGELTPGQDGCIRAQSGDAQPGKAIGILGSLSLGEVLGGIWGFVSTEDCGICGFTTAAKLFAICKEQGSILM